jgi:hypothetical protein
VSGMRFPKPPRGSATLEREAKRKDIEGNEDEVIRAAKVRDGFKCRWPEAHKCRGFLEGAHILDKGMGGDHGLRTTRDNIISLCAWIHRRGPQSIHGKQLKVVPETPNGADGPVSFWKQDEAGEYYMVARERLIGALERD